MWSATWSRERSSMATMIIALHIASFGILTVGILEMCASEESVQATTVARLGNKLASTEASEFKPLATAKMNTRIRKTGNTLHPQLTEVEFKPEVITPASKTPAKKEKGTASILLSTKRKDTTTRNWSRIIQNVKRPIRTTKMSNTPTNPGKIHESPGTKVEEKKSEALNRNNSNSATMAKSQIPTLNTLVETPRKLKQSTTSTHPTVRVPFEAQGIEKQKQRTNIAAKAGDETQDNLGIADNAATPGGTHLAETITNSGAEYYTGKATGGRIPKKGLFIMASNKRDFFKSKAAQNTLAIMMVTLLLIAALLAIVTYS